VRSAVSEERVCNSCATCIRTQFHMEPPSRVSIYAWYKKFEQKGCICKGKRPGPASVSDATVDRVRTCFQRSPQKSTRRTNRKLQLPQTTVSKILRKRLLMSPYKLQLVQALKPKDLAVRYEFCREILARIENDNDLPARFIFSDEATFHINSKVIRHNVRVLGNRKSSCHPRARKRFTKSECVLCQFKLEVLWPLLFSWKTPSRVTLT
jgi:hypothetical protein